MLTGVVEATAFVVTVKVAEFEPAGTVTLGGTVATAVFALLSVTTAPPLGAGLVRVAVPTDVLPPTTAVGLKVMLERLDGEATPIAAISARPIFCPTAELTVNCIHVTVREGNETVKGLPSFGSAPTGTLLPSLKERVPDVTLSVRFGRSYKTACQT